MSAQAIINLLNNRVDLVQRQDAAAKNIRDLFAGVQERAANQKLPEVAKYLKAAISEIENGKVFGIEKTALTSTPMFSAAALGFKKMNVRLNWGDDLGGISHDPQTFERWALPLRPLNSEERYGAIFNDGEFAGVMGVIAAGGAAIAYDAVPQLLTSASRLALHDSVAAFGALAMGLGATYFTAGKAFRNAKRFMASMADQTLVAVLPEALNAAEQGHLTGAGMRANLMKVQLGRTPVRMPQPI